jgi:hypothetical protein
MKQEQFDSLLPHILEDLICMIVKNEKISDEKAVEKLYSSQLYACLEKEETKVWHLSTEALYSLLRQEEKEGKLSFPD